MTKITIDRAIVEQALEALEWHYRQGHSNTLGGLRLKIDEKALRNLRAALAQQNKPAQDVLLSMAGLALDALEHDRQAATRAGRNISMLSLNAIEGLRAAIRAALAQEQSGANCAIYEAPPGFVLNPDYLVPELRAQRDALLEVLKKMRIKYGEYACSVCDQADAAIKAMEETK
jgi:hypothetical protein